MDKEQEEEMTCLMQIALNVRSGLRGKISEERTIYKGGGDIVMVFRLALDGREYSLRIKSEDEEEV